MDLFSVYGIAVWFYAVSAVTVGVMLGSFGVALCREIKEQLEWSGMRFRQWLRLR